ncbi:hypothetical protein VCV18_006759 [Metarhizium anisopliae]
MKRKRVKSEAEKGQRLTLEPRSEDAAPAGPVSPALLTPQPSGQPPADSETTSREAYSHQPLEFEKVDYWRKKPSCSNGAIPSDWREVDR